MRASLWGTQGWAPCPVVAERPDRPGWSALVAESREGSAADPGGHTAASSVHLGNWPGDARLMSWNSGLPPSLPPSSSPLGAAGGGGEGQGVGQGGPAPWSFSKQPGGFSSRRREKAGVWKDLDLLQGVRCPSLGAEQREREETSFQLQKVFTNSVWNFPAQLLSPPAPSRPTGWWWESLRELEGRSVGPLSTSTHQRLCPGSSEWNLSFPRSSLALGPRFLLFLPLLWSLQSTDPCPATCPPRATAWGPLSPSPPPGLASCWTHCPTPSTTQLSSARGAVEGGDGERRECRNSLIR